MPTIADLRKTLPWADDSYSDTDVINAVADHTGLPSSFVAEQYGIKQNKGLMGDLGTSLKRGVEGLPGVVTGIADAATAPITGDRYFSKGADALGRVTGFQPEKWANDARLNYSQDYNQADQEIQKVWNDENTNGWDVAAAYARKPSYVLNSTVESLPSMLGGGLIGRGLKAAGALAGADGVATGYLERKLGERGANLVAAHGGEAAVTAGQQMQQIDPNADPRLAGLASLAAGVGTGLIGAAAGRVANRLGLADVEQSLMGVRQGGADVSPLGWKRRVAGGMVSEGLLEEAPQSAQEQMWQNVAEGKNVWDGVGRQAIEGALAGGLMGGGFNLRGGRQAAQQPELITPDQPTDLLADYKSNFMNSVEGASEDQHGPFRTPVDSFLSQRRSNMLDAEYLGRHDLLAQQQQLNPSLDGYSQHYGNAMVDEQARQEDIVPNIGNAPVTNPAYARDIRQTRTGGLTLRPLNNGTLNESDWLPEQAPAQPIYTGQQRLSPIEQYAEVKRKADAGVLLSPFEATVLRAGVPQTETAPIVQATQQRARQATPQQGDMFGAPIQTAAQVQGIQAPHTEVRGANPNQGELFDAAGNATYAANPETQYAQITPKNKATTLAAAGVALAEGRITPEQHADVFNVTAQGKWQKGADRLAEHIATTVAEQAALEKAEAKPTPKKKATAKGKKNAPKVEQVAQETPVTTQPEVKQKPTATPAAVAPEVKDEKSVEKPIAKKSAVEFVGSNKEMNTMLDKLQSIIDDKSAPRWKKKLAAEHHELLSDRDLNETKEDKKGNLELVHKAVFAEVKTLAEEHAENKPQLVSHATENPDVKYKRYTSLNGKEFSTAEEAAQWLATNASRNETRQVAKKLIGFLKNIPVHFNDSKSGPDWTRVHFANNSIGLCALWSDGSLEVAINTGSINGPTEENLLHELVHAATNVVLLKGGPAAKEFENIAKQVRTNLQTWNGSYPINDVTNRDISDFFKSKNVTGDTLEFVAYAFSSPSLQDAMSLMGADGKWFKDYRTQSEKQAINKNSSVTEKQYVHVPEYSLLHRLVDAVRGLFGLPKLYAKVIQDAIVTNGEIGENNRKAKTIEFKTLKEKIDLAFDQLLQEARASQQGAATPTVRPNIESAEESKAVGDAPLVDKHGIITHNTASLRTTPRDRQVSSSFQRYLSMLGKYIGQKFHGIFLGGMFGHDLEQWANKYMPGEVRKYFESIWKKQNIRGAIESRSQKIGLAYNALRTQDQDEVNKFLDESTIGKKWGFEPTWLQEERNRFIADEKAKIAELRTHDVAAADKAQVELDKILADKTLTVDADMAAKFNALSKDAQLVAKAALQEGHNILTDHENAILLRINEAQEDYDTLTKELGETAEDTKKVKQILSELRKEYGIYRHKMMAPYMPLYREGTHVVIAKSKELLAAEKALAEATNGDSTDDKKVKELEEARDALRGNRDHYQMFLRDHWGSIDKETELKEDSRFAGGEITARERTLEERELSELPRQMMERVVAMMKNETGNDKRSRASRVAAAEINQLFIKYLNGNHPEKNQLKREGVYGYDTDMMHGFLNTARKQAASIAALGTQRDMMEALFSIRKEAMKATGEKANKLMQVSNELSKRYMASVQYRETPLQDFIMRNNSLWMLLSSPAYYLKNGTQTYMVTAPVLSGRFGAKAYTAITNAYMNDVKLLLEGNDKWDISKIKSTDGRDEHAMLKSLEYKNLLSLGVDMELGDMAQKDNVFMKATGLNKVVRGLRTGVEHVEKINRVSAALAAYRLMFDSKVKELGTEKAHEEATAYAEQIVRDTHGDYSAANAPRWFMQGGQTLPVKALLQFKKFQIIQLSLMAKSLHSAFLNENLSADEKAVARRVVRNLFLSYGALTGGVGLPVIGMGVPALLAAIFGGDDDKDMDSEYRIRRAIGDKHIADFILHGGLAALGADMSTSLGAGSILNPVPFMSEGKTTRETVTNALWATLGPTGSRVQKAADGLDYLKNGDVQKAMEQVLPKGLADFSTSVRIGTEGVTDKKGDVVMRPEDINGLQLFMKAIGIPPTVITDRTWKAGVKFQIEQDIQGEATEIRRKVEQATRDKDTAAIPELRNEFMELQKKKAELGLHPQTIKDFYNIPKEMAKREKNVMSGIEYTKGNKGLVQKLSDLDK